MDNVHFSHALPRSTTSASVLLGPVPEKELTHSPQASKTGAPGDENQHV